MTEDRRQNTEYRRKTRDARRCAMTLIETIVSLAIMAIVFAVIVPQFAIMRNNWDSKQAAAETLQNGRILIDHLNRNLSKAVSITAVSDSSTADGYIQFLDNDGNNLRYEIVSSYVQFGVVDSLSDLAGPVSQLQFSCYDACDLDTALSSPIDTNTIRFVEAQTTLTNSSGPDKTLMAAAYLRTNSSTATGAGWELTKGTNFEFEDEKGKTPALEQIDTTHYLCAYSGPDKDRGWAVVLTVDTGTWEITKGTNFEFDTKKGKTPALAQIDTSHYLCAYSGDEDDGWATVLTVNTDTWAITKETPLIFSPVGCKYPALIQIDDSHYLCVYQEGDLIYDDWAVVLTVNTDTWEITRETELEFDTENSGEYALTQIDGSHYLCVYQDMDGSLAVVLTVDTDTWAITRGTPFEYDGQNPALSKIDSTHYLCAYRGPGIDGWATVLTVDTDDWSISKGISFEFDPVHAETPALAQIDSTHYLCVYKGHVSVRADNGWAVILTVDTGNWTVSQEEASLEWDLDGATPTLAKINDSLFLCAYQGPYEDGWSVVMFVEGSTEIRP